MYFCCADPQGNRRSLSHYSWSTVLSLTIVCSNFLSSEMSKNPTKAGRLTSYTYGKTTFLSCVCKTKKVQNLYRAFESHTRTGFLFFQLLTANCNLEMDQRFFNSCNGQTLFISDISHAQPPKPILQSARFFLNIPWISLCILKNVALKLKDRHWKHIPFELIL